MTAKQSMPIPRRIKVGDRMYSVDIIQSMQRARERGRVWYDAGRIQIGQTSNVNGRKFTDAEISDTFWHEMTHAILYEMGHRLYNDEHFVTEFSGRLAKAIQSAKFK